MLEDAFFLGRALRAQGHDVKLIPTQFMKPFVKSNKSDFFGKLCFFSRDGKYGYRHYVLTILAVFRVFLMRGSEQWPQNGVEPPSALRPRSLDTLPPCLGLWWAQARRSATTSGRRLPVARLLLRLRTSANSPRSKRSIAAWARSCRSLSDHGSRIGSRRLSRPFYR